MQFSIGSYSFHRALAAGKQDMFGYITDSKDLGMAQLDPWNSHLAPLKEEDVQLKESGSTAERFSDVHDEYIQRVRKAAAEAGIPFGCLAVDGAHIYEDTAEARAANRACAYRWIDIAERLGATEIRIDSGGPMELTDEMFAIIHEGYQDLLPRCEEKGLRLVIENHWGSSSVPKNVTRILDENPGLGLLFDSNNWADGLQEEGWNSCAQYAKSVHIKTFAFDEDGNEPSVDLSIPIRLLLDAGYDGVWGIESVPKDGDEYEAIRKTRALIERVVQAQ